MKIEFNVEHGDNFIFRPEPDITAYELARIWQFIGISLNPKVFEDLDSELQRHFKQDQ